MLGKRKSGIKKSSKSKRRKVKARSDTDISESSEDDDVVEEKVGEVDFSSVSSDFEAQTPEERARTKADYESRIRELKSEAEKLSPNLRAIERFEDVQSKFDATKSDWETKRTNATVCKKQLPCFLMLSMLSLFSCCSLFLLFFFFFIFH